MNTRHIARTLLGKAIVIGLLSLGTLLLAHPGLAIPFPVNISVQPNPATVGTAPNTRDNNVILANGASTIGIKATVTPKDANNVLRPEEQVTFITDKGQITSPVTIQNGVATTTLTSTNTAGTATVTARVTDTEGTKTATTAIYMVKVQMANPTGDPTN